MKLLWPWFLILLGLIPLILGIYIWILRRRRRYVVRYSSLVLVRQALPEHSRLRRHLPFALFLLALASLVVAFGRPVALIKVPAGQTTVILAMDVSRSMCTNDIAPNRLEAAKDAALQFIERQEASMQIGIVAFAGFAELVQPPTADKEMLQDAIRGLTTGRRTAIGSAILRSLDAIAEINPRVEPSASGPSPDTQVERAPAGNYEPDIIVLLTDGASNAGPLPLDAAQQAVDRGIRVYTIGYGTQYGGVMDCDDNFWGGGGGYGGQGFGRDPFGGGFRLSIDEPTLKQVAEMTGGTYYSATSASELQGVFRELPTYMITRTETTEISFAFAAFGALLAALAMLLALLWHPLP